MVLKSEGYIVPGGTSYGVAIPYLVQEMVVLAAASLTDDEGGSVIRKARVSASTVLPSAFLALTLLVQAPTKYPSLLPTVGTHQAK